jgi:putative membrane protein
MIRWTMWGVAAMALAMAPAARAYDQGQRAEDKAEEAKQDTKEAAAEAKQEGKEAKAEAKQEGREVRASMENKDKDSSTQAGTSDTRAGSTSGSSAGAVTGGADSAAGHGTAPGATGATTPSATGTSAGAARGADDKTSRHDNTDLIKKLWTANLMEVESAKIAKDKSQNESVKQFADRMEKDHSKLGDRLKELADKRNADLDEDAAKQQHKAHLDQMDKMDATAFDSHFKQMMVSEHDKMLQEVTSALDKAKKTGDNELASILQSARTSIQEHQRLAKNLGKDSGSTRSGRRGSSDRSGTTGSTDRSDSSRGTSTSK